MYHPFAQLFLARLREFYREPETVFWVYVFPLILAVGLGVAFWSREPEPPVVDVVGEPGAAVPAAETLQAAGVRVEVHDEEEARRRLRVGKTMLYLVPAAGGYQYVYDPAREDSVRARHQVEAALLRARAGGSPGARAEDVHVQEPGNRYIDFLLPGLIGLNLMGGGLWGVGFVTVDMRVRKLLKRLLATPMRRDHFLLALLSARLVLMVPEMVLLLLLGRLAFDVPVRGSWLAVCLLIFLGAAAFAGIGLLLATRTEKTETISGLINLVMLPMWLLSGTFFSSERFPDAVQPFIQALPLTQFNNAMRAVMLEGASFADVAWRAGLLAAWAVVTFVLALKLFRWQ